MRLSRIFVAPAVLAAVLMATSATAKQPGKYHEEILSAVVCKSPPLLTFRDMKKHTDALKKEGISYEENGKTGYAERITLTLKQPIVIEGATATVARMEMANRYENKGFGGYVYGEFTGDYRKVVKALKLRKTRNFAGGTSYEQPGPQNACPPLVELLPLGNNKFLLGCGWCNG